MQKRWLFSILLIFLCGIGTGYLIFAHKTSGNVDTIRVNSPEYHFINPLILLDNSHVNFPELDGVKEEVLKAINNAKESGDIKEASFYFRDLNSSKWTGIDEQVPYSPASMLKVITLIGVLKAAESDPELLAEKVFFIDTPDSGQHFPPKTYLPAGNYTVRDLLVQMIVNSDNAAMEKLNGLRPDSIYEVYKILELPDPRTNSDDFMSVEMYSRLWRALYSSTYLSHSSSEEALKLLSYTNFDSGLVAGVGSNTVIAHKFGEHTLVNASGQVLENQLHDCGIVYYPGKPYLLCIMTRGNDFSKLEGTIQHISSIVYDAVGKK